MVYMLDTSMFDLPLTLAIDKKLVKKVKENVQKVVKIQFSGVRRIFWLTNIEKLKPPTPTHQNFKLKSPSEAFQS